MDPAWVSHVTNELSQMRQEIVALRNEVNALNNDASTDLRREVNAIWDQFRLSFDSIIAIRNEMLLKFALYATPRTKPFVFPDYTYEQGRQLPRDSLQQQTHLQR